jgi:hypothetical protein
MRREEEYQRLADFARKRAREEKNVESRSHWEILGATYVRLADQSKKIDDTSTYSDASRHE